MPSDANNPASAGVSGRLDAVFQALSHERRRRALYYLRQRPDGVASVPELAAALADVPDADDHRTEEVAASLVHHHLPKLADAGLVEHDTRLRTVRYDAGNQVTTGLIDLAADVETR